MTLPQVLYMLLGKKEHEAADARQFFTLTMAAIGSCFGKDGERLANKILDSLDGPPVPIDELIRDMPREQALIMFGAARLAELENGQETNSD